MQDEEEKSIDVADGELDSSQAPEAGGQQKYYTCKQVATEFGYSRAYVGRLCNQGRFEGVIQPVGGGQWKIPASEVEKMRTKGLTSVRRVPPPPPPSSKIALDQAAVKRIGVDLPVQDAPPPSATPTAAGVKKKRHYPWWPLPFYEEVDEE